MMKAKIVPIFTISPMMSIGVMLPTIAAMQPDQNRVLVGRAKFRMDRREELARQQAVVRHGIQHARLPEQHHQHHAGESGQRSGGDQIGCLGEATVQERNRQRRFNVDFLPRHHAGQHGSDQNVKNRAHHQRSDDADGQVPLRVFGLLRRGGNRVEADIRKKYVRRAAPDSAEKPIGAKRIQSWPQLAGFT